MSLDKPSELPDTQAGDVTERATHFVENYAKQIVFGVVALLIILAVAIAIRTTGREAAEESWSRFAGAAGASDYANVAVDYPESEVAVWARLTEGEMLLREAIQLQFTDREAANREFKAAGEAFDTVLADQDAPAMARERALMGKARLADATSDGSMEDAIAAYQKVIDEFPGSVYTDAAKKRIEDLKSEEVKSFYNWFAELTPKPEDRARPQDSMPPGHPEVPVTLPPIPDELQPPDWSELKVDDETPPFEIPETPGDSGDEAASGTSDDSAES